jgi:hypothetical protein
LAGVVALEATSDAFDRRGHGLQPVQRHHYVGLVGQRVQVLGNRRATAALADCIGGVGELARGRDQGDGARQAFGGVRVGQRAEHLEA